MNASGRSLDAVPVYEYRCVECDARFEQRRAMADADASTACPAGHPNVRRLLSVFAASSGLPEAGGGCCGGGCGCG